jgi:hypothetical protein
MSRFPGKTSWPVTSGLPLDLDDRRQVVLANGLWRIRDEHGCVLSDPNESYWGDEDDEDALGFASPSEALEAYLRVEMISQLSQARRRAAFEKLGRPDDQE